MSGERNLLFGILALQMDFLTRDALIAGLHAWVLDKKQPLGRILQDQGALRSDVIPLLDALVDKHLQAHGNDPQQSLAALGATGSARDALASIADPDLQASLQHLSLSPTPTEEPSTTGPWVGDATSLGQRFRVLRPHARGGLGEVYVAYDQELDREVALKEIQLQHADNPHSRSRFVREAEITGGLEHPGIVPVYGLGHYADGRPFYAMRFIRGDSLKEAVGQYHRQEKQAPRTQGLALRKLLQRLVDVCNAVGYAHSRGVLHRDLKPGNILLGKYGETLVVDWGLAKPVGRVSAGSGASEEQTLAPRSARESEATQAGLVLGTPAYMSPEQAEGRLDLLGPASDVYSLGATLYSILTGKAPFEGSTASVLEQVRKGDITPPRQVDRRIPPALEAICRKAMARQVEERYETPRHLADDLERWLADEPVEAYQEPMAARLARWTRRNQPLMTGMTALLVTAVFSLVVGILAVNRERERTAAEQGRTKEALAAETKRRQQAREALDTMSSQVIEDWLSQQKARELSEPQKKFLRNALASYEEFASDTADDELSRVGVAAAYGRVGHIQAKLGQAADAEAGYRRALELYARLETDFPKVPLYRQAQAQCHNNLGLLFSKTGTLKDAERAYRDALAIQIKLADDFPNLPEYRHDLAVSQNNMGNLLIAIGQPKDAESVMRDALTIATQLVLEFPTVPRHRQLLAGSQTNLGVLLRNTGRPKEAEIAYRAAHEIRKLLAADFPSIPLYRLELAMSFNNLGRFLAFAGRSKDAVIAYRDAIGIYKQLTADFPTVPDYRLELARSHKNLGNLFAANSQPKDAEPAYGDAAVISKQLVFDYPNVVENREVLTASQNDLGVLLAEIGRLQDAETTYRDAFAIQKRMVADFPRVPDYQAELAGTMINLGNLFLMRKEYLPARRMYEEAMPHLQAAMKSNPRHPRYQNYNVNLRLGLGQVLAGLGDHVTAAQIARQLGTEISDPGNNAYYAACILAVCARTAEEDAKLSKTKRGVLALQYADQAVGFLRGAVTKGFKDLQNMRSEKDLDALRNREDFKKLLADLEAKVNNSK